MKKILKNSLKTRKFLESLPIVYVILSTNNEKFFITEKRLAKWKYDKKTHQMIPYVYVYEDFNGEADNFIAESIYDAFCCYHLYCWTLSPKHLYTIRDALNINAQFNNSFDKATEQILLESYTWNL